MPSLRIKTKSLLALKKETLKKRICYEYPLKSPFSERLGRTLQEPFPGSFTNSFSVRSP
ncbi:Hypothetical protein Minf_1018 [Methylacidiphilum infernorum V4]|uniref:Uncharacterized protein n=1 Tax=Methylacidiphilum infernorum (isolate V4) TaxID=481448 RepID=B3DUS0_METI4|nr:Hypothetical protein Minf_1018 [Methylacidiphilum infernorum V4]